MLGIEKIFGRRSPSEFNKNPPGKKQSPESETPPVPIRPMKPEEVETRAYPAEDVFLTLEGMFDRWKQTQKKDEELPGTFALVAEKARTLERIYRRGGTDPTHLSGAFERFERQVGQLEEEMALQKEKDAGALSEQLTQKQRAEELKEWRSRVLAILSGQQLAGKLSGADLEEINKALEAYEYAASIKKPFKPISQPREVELADSFLLAAQLLVKRLKPEITEFKARVEGIKTVEEQLAELHRKRDELRERLAEIKQPEEDDKMPPKRKWRAATREEMQKRRLQTYEKEQKALIRAFEQVNGQIYKLDPYAKTEKIPAREMSIKHKINPHDDTQQEVAPPLA